MSFRGGGIFGGNTQSNSSLFSNVNPNNQPFQSMNQPQNTSVSVFGGNNNQNAFNMGQQNTSTGIFDTSSQSQQNSPLFSSPIPALSKNNGGIFNNTNTNTQPAFGGFGNNTQNSLNTPVFGTTSFFNATSAPSVAGNIGNTFSPTAGIANKFVPVKSKNSKIDGRHLIKCITGLDQNTDFCLKELRIRNLMSIGSQVTNPMTTPFTNQANSFSNTGNTNTSPFSFSNLNNAQQQTQVGSASPGGSLFGGGFKRSNQPTTPTLTNQVSFGQGLSSPPNNSIFGNTTQNTQNASNNSFFNNMSTAIFRDGISNQNPNFNSLSPGGLANNSPMGGVQTQPSTGIFGGQSNNNGSIFGGNPALNNTSYSLGTSLLPNNPPPSQPAFNQFNSPLSYGSNDPNILNMSLGYNLITSLLNVPPNPNMPLVGNPQIFLVDIFNKFINSTKKNDPFDQLAARFTNQSQKTSSNTIFGQFMKNYLSPGLSQSLENKSSPTKNELFDGIARRLAENLPASNQKGDEDYFENIKYNNDISKYRKTYRKPADLDKTPYIFKQITSDNFNHKMNLSYKENFEIKMVKPKIKQSTEQMLKKTPLDDFQECFDKFKKKTLREIIVKPDELPINDGGFIINPNLDKLSELTTKQLTNISNVCIENKYGWLKFKQPINLVKKKLSQCIEIRQDSIEIYDEEWQGKRCELHFKNFSEYKNVNEIERRKIERKMRRWTDKNRMNILSFDKNSGDLTVQVCF